ncbi:hypothetical protein [Aeoliella mucimassa]|uniref:PEP-CTERM protein-sorting domain-containing protein n=1 Tax=Aeoliella mucimassa TaxID=2527972 RepID=A0A518AVB1_9BACT|nr:hypothetical protein [Aeoliella mucimassa]QDU58648.1 hypothetical protein Pan181_48870 [Aeoliella mucimassa]
MRLSCVIGKWCLVGAMLVGAIAAPANAHTDVLIARQESKLVTGATDFSSASMGQRVFSEDLALWVDGWGATAPGFGALGNEALLPTGIERLPGSEQVEFSVPAVRLSGGSESQTLWYWDGIGDVQFGEVPTGHSLGITGSVDQLFVDEQSTDLHGFPIATTSSTGSLHQHLLFELAGEGGSDSQDGLYLLPMELSMAGLEPAEPVYLLFNKGLDGAVREQAAEWVATHQVPEPATGCMLLLVGGLGVLLLGKRVSR